MSSFKPKTISLGNPAAGVDFDRVSDAVSRLRAHDWLNPGFGHRWWPKPDMRPLRPAPWAPVFMRLSAGAAS